MSQIVIVGGKLQGSEAAYLGREAGIDVVLIDSDPKAPARFLCTEFICGDVLSEDPSVVRALAKADMILPTMENEAVLEGLTNICGKNNYKLAFDWEAYQISSSKKKSDRLFKENGLPCPKYFPEGQAPYIAKPDSQSGSHGVKRFEDRDSTKCFAEGEGKDFIIQEYKQGPSYSIEIIGEPGNYRTYVPTEIFVDSNYDCNVAATLRNIEREKVETLNSLGTRIAELLQLKGIMDLEVIDCNGEINILEIDARLPSQTSIVVYHASGMNYIKELYDLFVEGKFKEEQKDIGQYASISHYLCKKKKIQCLGERIMVEGGALRYNEDMCKTAKVVTDYYNGASEWRGAFVCYGKTAEELKALEESTLRRLEKIGEERNGAVFRHTEATIDRIECRH